MENKKNKTVITDFFFNALLSNAICDTGNNKSVVGFSSIFKNFKIGFYIDDGDESNVLIDDFGLMKDGEWLQLEPTEKQMGQMKKVISEKLDELFQSESKSEVDGDFNGDYYNYYGVNRAMFI